MNLISMAPSGEAFPLPGPDDHAAERDRIERLVDEAKGRGQEIVVVLGVGFVGSVMAAIIADSTDRATGMPSKFVIGVDLLRAECYWKIAMLASGRSPVKAEDPEVEPMISRCVQEKRTLTATYLTDCLAHADCVVIDIQCDYTKHELGNSRHGEAEMHGFNAAVRSIGEKIRPECLVLIETTVAPGTTEFVAYPILKKAFRLRGIPSMPLLAHSFERVMPGRDYVASVRDYWRVCSGCNDAAKERVVAFLSSVINTQDYPLTVMDRPIESETTKIIENSYRATILAFMNEWSVFSERNGVDLIKVVKAIKARPTHSNIIFPGPGVGGYCLPKDGALGYWSYKHILGFEDGPSLFRITPTAIDINDTRSLHAAELVRDALRNMGRYIAGATILLAGASYRQDVGDTRYSGSEMMLRKLAEMGAEIRVHDPYVTSWTEFEDQETHSHSWSRFFQNQEGLEQMEIQKDLRSALRRVEALVLAVPHASYMDLDPDQVVAWAGNTLAIVDCFGILSDAKIRRYLELGCEVKGLGRGHITRLKREVQDKHLRASEGDCLLESSARI